MILKNIMVQDLKKGLNGVLGPLLLGKPGGYMGGLKTLKVKKGGCRKRRTQLILRGFIG